MISKGYSTKEIASHLNLSEETIKSHRRNLFNRFSARNSPHLILKAIGEGLLKENRSISII